MNILFTVEKIVFTFDVLFICLQSKDTPDIVSNQELRAFWISWANYRLMVGYGAAIGKNMFLDYQESEPYPVTAISISTGWGAEGEWEFSDLEGNVKYLCFSGFVKLGC